jgi:hypothetical protein
MAPPGVPLAVAWRAVSLSVQTFLPETRKLSLQETLLNLGAGAVREYREGSVSRNGNKEKKSCWDSSRRF